MKNTYYQRDRDHILNRAKDYYKNDKGRLRDNARKKYRNSSDICQYWYFLDKSFKYESYRCNGSHELIQKAINFNAAAMVFVGRRD